MLIRDEPSFGPPPVAPASSLILLVSAMAALQSGCPTFPESELHHDGGEPCTDRDRDSVDSCNGDCDDGQREVFTGQKTYFDTPTRKGGFDYDCDGEEQPEYPSLAECRAAGAGCEGDGWRDVVPACGQEATLMRCEKTGQKCSARPAGRQTQHCR